MSILLFMKLFFLPAFLFIQVIGRKETCKPATSPISLEKHYYAPDNLNVASIAFSSCYVPEWVTGTKFWTDVRTKSRPDLWLWLGDNMYKDGTNMDEKRKMYNAAREEASYVSHGPLKPGEKG